MSVTLKYSEISSFPFNQTIQKLAQTQTHGSKASALHKLAVQLDYARKEIQKEYQAEIAEKFGKRDAAGALIRPEGEAMGFTPEDAKLVEFTAAQVAFGEKTVTLEGKPLTPDFLQDFKVSAADLAALQGLYAENEEKKLSLVPPSA